MKKQKADHKADYIVISIFTITILGVFITTYFSTKYMNEYTELIQKNIEKRLVTEATAIREMVSVEELDLFHDVSDTKQELYQEILMKLQNYANNADLEYIYFVRLVDGKMQYIFDTDTNPNTHCGLDYLEVPKQLVLDTFAGNQGATEIGEYTKGWEGLLSAFLPIYDIDGNIVAVVGVDISDADIVSRKEQTKTFSYISASAILLLGVSSVLFIIRYRRKAQAYNEASLAKGEFLSRMSHEIRTPMNAIIGFCRMAQNTEDLKQKEEYINNISMSSDYLLELINGVLDISKIEASKFSLDVEKASPYYMMNNIEIILASQVMKKEQKFTIDIDENVPKYAYFDITRLTQIIINLTANAVKFTPEKGEINIYVKVIDKSDTAYNIEFIIRDNGIGIPEEKIATLFEPFEQVDGSITRKYGGTGLGLTISKLFIEMMKGTISVTSKENEGSTFKFNVWLEIVPETEFPSEEVVDDSVLDCTGMVFLLAEDNKVNQVIAGRLLEELGATVEYALDGNECIEMFVSNPDRYDIIFMDVQMPEVDGLEATERIRAIGSEKAKIIPIIAMTANVFKEDIDNMIEAGMDSHIGKPLKTEKVISAIKKSFKKKE